ncbi:nuclear pore complex protein [Canna indica]|uniref:Nuclear pore complex protein n=1 Tax=Canna indica TaxID=4628 RepID=A0AAQ3QDD1_9LILI|nr:nuclear pore complex protein [Canna indica]
MKRKELKQLEATLFLGGKMSEAWRSGDRQRMALDGKTAGDEEAEALLSCLFHEFFLSSEIEEGVDDKIREKGAFLKGDEINVLRSCIVNKILVIVSMAELRLMDECPWSSGKRL